MKLIHPSLKENWRFYLRWIAIGIIFASAITLNCKIQQSERIDSYH